MFTKKKNQTKKKQDKGFTLIELLVCIAIVAILVAIALPAFSAQKKKAEDTVLYHNMRALKSMFLACTFDYPSSRWHGNYADDWEDDWEYGEGTLNNYMEWALEHKEDGHYANKINLVNPTNQNKAILDYNATLSSGDGYCPAAFFTADSSYAQSGGGSTQNIVGTIVVYFHQNAGTTEYMEFYYVDRDGAKSEPSRISM